MFIFKKIILSFLMITFMLSPVSVFEFGIRNTTNKSVNLEINYIFAYPEDGEAHSGNSANPIKLHNPLGDGNIQDIPTFVEKLLEIVMKVGVPLIAIAIIYTGYLFIAAQGNPEKLKKAKDAIIYVFIGSIILLGAYVIAQTLQGTINAIRGK